MVNSIIWPPSFLLEIKGGKRKKNSKRRREEVQIFEDRCKIDKITTGGERKKKRNRGGTDSLPILLILVYVKKRVKIEQKVMICGLVGGGREKRKNLGIH